MGHREQAGGPTRRQLLAYAGAAAGAAAVGTIGFGATPAFAAVAWRYPFTSAYPVSSGFGPRPSPGGVGSTNHQGIDFAAAQDTRIHAVASGTVIFTGVSGGYGNLTRIQHADGYVSYYGHQNHIDIAKGASVSAGQFIGRVGTTGDSTGNHLHLGVTLNGTFIDPAPFIIGAPYANDSTAPSTPRDDDFTIIKSPGRGAAVLGAGYFRALPTEEFETCARALFGDPVIGNDRQFDVWKSIAISGTAA
ncbi:M23 family metallopeptidase [Curtobacterium sp. VKM Ac-2865]|uniref:M23 family metallopeptidase n=1 Tax=Curtobacterium sp. VKM Ac-2865 TaxID=2783817 RepID=UPI00188DBBC9|nr:M23 family metallopeptidase [Curtobacterium sp. VKM Ac-2865]MBF4582484.1 M23 family metallopeptidase [Curtobacterium sp. VKM Ac-2865]